MDSDDWSADANKALAITLVKRSPSGPIPFATFHPAFTYSIFDDERIFGFHGLKINVRYRVDDMRPHLKVTYREKFQAVGETEPADITAILKNHLPQVAFSTDADFAQSTKQSDPDWTPPGELLERTEDSGSTYEIWKANMADPATKQMISRLRFFVPLFIEGGTYIDTDDPSANRWTVFLLFKKEHPGDTRGTGEYVFVGYSTVYRFFYFRPPTPPTTERKDIELPYKDGDFSFDDLPSRARLSQFIILPEFQHKGNGPRLYNTIYKYYYDDPLVYELTVEDPNESFDDMRDICDLAFLRTLPEFDNLSIDPSIKLPKTGPVPRGIVDQKLLEDIRHKAKIIPRQFARLVEMHLMSKLPASVMPGFPTKNKPPPATPQDKQAYRLWKVYTKIRLYRHNADALGAFELDERLEKLNETLAGLELEYSRILLAVKRREKVQTNGKRKADEDAENSNKRARFADAEPGTP